MESSKAPSIILVIIRTSERLKNKRPTWCHLLFYFTSYVLNMFRTLIYPSLGACDYSVELPHWFFVLGSMCVGVSVWLVWSGIHVAGWNSSYYVCAQHVSGINISIIRSLRLFCSITTLVVLFLVRCVLEFRCGWVGVVSVMQASACNTDTTPNQPHRNSNTHRTKNNKPMC